MAPQNEDSSSPDASSKVHSDELNINLSERGSQAATGDDSYDQAIEAESKFDDLEKGTLRDDGYGSTLRRSIPTSETLATATGTSPSKVQSRHASILSNIRSRADPDFTHPLSHVQTSPSNIVDFDGKDDPYHPLNWTLRRKSLTTLLYGLMTMSATWASSSYSTGTDEVASYFHVGTQVSTLGTTLFLLGFGTGPLVWAPLSEVYGRRLAVMTPMFVGICFSFAAGVSKDLQSLMITRFFSAFFASAPVTNTGGVLGDLYTPAERGMAIAGYAMAVVAGPALGKCTQRASFYGLLQSRDCSVIYCLSVILCSWSSLSIYIKGCLTNLLVCIRPCGIFSLYSDTFPRVAMDGVPHRNNPVCHPSDSFCFL